MRFLYTYVIIHEELDLFIKTLNFNNQLEL